MTSTMKLSNCDLDEIDTRLGEEGLHISGVMRVKTTRFTLYGFQASIRKASDPTWFAFETGDNFTECLQAVMLEFGMTGELGDRLAAALRENIEARLEAARGEND